MKINQRASHLANQLAALGNPVRLSILRQVGKKASAVGDIQSKLRIPWSTLSHHLEVLREAGLLTQKREGTFLHYKADPAAIRALSTFLLESCK
jgi:DNA-binding transcriptional ArsR family regulator